MNYLNKALIIGNITRDPEVRTTPQGIPVATFTIATNIRWTNQAGEKQDKAEFHNVVAWRRLAEICQQYLKKGSKVFVEGRIQTRNWDDAQGLRHWRTEIITENLIMLDRPSGTNNNGNNDTMPDIVPPTSNLETATEEQPINVEEIPF